MKYSDKEIKDKILEIMTPKDHEEIADYAEARVDDESKELYDIQKRSHAFALLHHLGMIAPLIFLALAALVAFFSYPLLSLTIIMLTTLLAKMFLLLAEKDMLVAGMAKSHVENSIKFQAIADLIEKLSDNDDELVAQIKELGKKHNGLLKKVAFHHEYDMFITEVQALLNNHKREIKTVVSQKGEEVQKYFDSLQKKPAKKAVNKNGKKSK